MTYKMKGHTLPGIKQKLSPTKYGGGMALERDKETKIGDSFRSKKTIDNRTRKNALERMAQETGLGRESAKQMEARARYIEASKTSTKA